MVGNERDLYEDIREKICNQYICLQIERNGQVGSLCTLNGSMYMYIQMTKLVGRYGHKIKAKVYTVGRWTQVDLGVRIQLWMYMQRMEQIERIRTQVPIWQMRSHLSLQMADHQETSSSSSRGISLHLKRSKGPLQFNSNIIFLKSDSGVQPFTHAAKGLNLDLGLI